MKIFRWISDNILLLVTLFLLVFIPLYPKKPLVDVVNTWVYIRLEDFIIVSVLIIWLIHLFRKKITLKTPLTMPILLFWIVGALSTIHGVLLIFPEIPNVFPNVALLSFLRRVEYLSLFFIAFAAVKDKKILPYVIGILVITLIAVVVYGVGQRYAGFPAYLTMNEEFAKGEAIQLSALSRVPSTFAGHYDLAAYLVLVIPIVVSLIFGFRNWFIKLFFLLAAGAGFILLFMTVSRVSFFVLFISLAAVLFFQKRKWFVLSLPVAAIIFIFIFLNFAPRLVDRFGNTVKEINVLVDAGTGEALGNIKDITREDFKTRPVRERIFRSRGDIDAKPEIKPTDNESASASAIIPFEFLPAKGVLLVPPNASTGENLPQGTGYINLALSPVVEQRDEFFYESREENASTSAEVQMFKGKFLVKKALAYDLSLTTRYQGEWPHAIEAFRRNVFLGSGYSSISLAIDNSYLRMLGEVGFLGFISFFIIFVTAGAYIKQTLPKVDSPLIRSFVIGFVAGTIGLMLNATLIDVFEASKVAFYLWLLTGITIGILHTYQTKSFAFYEVIKKVATSSYAVIIYLTILTVFIFSPMLGNYFVGDDFTWFRWAANANGIESIIQYFTQSDNFFYRPGTKLYFQIMYSIFWLNPVAYHMVSLVLHILVVLLVFILSKKILRSFNLAVLSAFLFAILSGYHEAVFWISSVGHLVGSLCVLLSIVLFSLWDERKNIIYYLLSLLTIGFGLLFQEMGVIAPLLIILYKFTNDKLSLANIKLNKMYYGFLFSPVILYLAVRFMANSHWAGGDYSYNLIKLPFNIVGNIIGYIMLSVLGPISLPFYEVLRNISREHIFISSIIVLIFIGVLRLAYKVFKKINKDDKRIIIFGIGFMFISLLPFLGLGNITSRYNYLVSFGFVILFAFLAKKLYERLMVNGRDIATAAMTLFLGFFFLLHIIQVQEIQGDWHGAGTKVNKFFVSIEGLYENYWSAEPMSLHFVNLPVRNGEAWVFPVGLQDALWFTFKNPDITIYQWQTVDEALAQINKPRNEKALLIDDQGVVTEQKKKAFK